MQLDLHGAGCAEAVASQEAAGTRVGRFRLEAQPAATQHLLQEEGQRRNQPEHDGDPDGAGFGHGEDDFERVQDPQRGHHAQVRRVGRRPHRRRRGQPDLHPVHLLAQQDRSDQHRGAGRDLQDSSLRAHLRPPPLELRRSAGDDVGLSQPGADLHEAEGPTSRLQLARCAQQRPHQRRRLLQQTAPDDRARVQDGLRLGLEREASAAEGRHRALVERRGCRADC